MPNYKAAFESASLDLSAIMSLLGFTSYPGVDPMLRAITDLVLAKAEAQALRDQVKALQSDANSYQSGYDEGRRMGTKHRQDEVEQLTREVAELREKNDKEWRRAGIAEENLRAVLSARVVVLPSVDSVMNIVMRYQWNEKTNVTGTTNWAANLGMKVVDEVKRLNGKVVSEGLLRRIVAEPVGGAVYDAIAELRAILGEDGVRHP